jgi:hypothetical protein
MFNLLIFNFYCPRSGQAIEKTRFSKICLRQSFVSGFARIKENNNNLPHTITNPLILNFYVIRALLGHSQNLQITLKYTYRVIFESLYLCYEARCGLRPHV